MIFKRIRESIRDYPRLEKTLILFHSCFAEIRFLCHAVVTDKIFYTLKRKNCSAFLGLQTISAFEETSLDVKTPDEFRLWLDNKQLDYSEGMWTFYIPPQDPLHEHFRFLKINYPEDAGLKILKDFSPPHKARYTNPLVRFTIGYILKRILTPSPVSLVRVANYLYNKNIGIKVYDLAVLNTQQRALTCYIVQHAGGKELRENDYTQFIETITELMKTREIAAISDRLDRIKDFRAPDCNGNLIYSKKDGRAVYVDFQGFMLLNEDKIIERALNDIGIVNQKETTGEQAASILSRCAHDLSSIINQPIQQHWALATEMMAEASVSVKGKVVYDIGCGPGLMVYNALINGARWGVGWDRKSVVKVGTKLMLSLGATRFTMNSVDMISQETDFLKDIPSCFKQEDDSILFCLNQPETIDPAQYLSRIPWKYVFLKGNEGEDVGAVKARLNENRLFRNIDILTHKTLMKCGKERVMVLFQRDNSTL